jgi:hypothetical protein
MPLLIFVGGLPGSGKTSHSTRLEEEGWTRFDDFQACATDNSELFRKARHYPDLVKTLMAGRRCVVADIRFVCAGYREDAKRTLWKDVGEIPLEWHIFECDREQCERNIRGDSRPPEPRLQALAEWAPKCSIPTGAVRLSVWRSCQ